MSGGSLHALPLMRWAKYFEHGTARVRGRLGAAVESDGGLTIGPGRVLVELVFHGGAAPRIPWARVTTHEAPDADRTLLEETVNGELAGALARVMGDLEIEAQTAAHQPLDLRLGEGLRLVIPPHTSVTISGATSGDAGGLTLRRPLVVGFGGEGGQVVHDSYRRLSRVAGVRVERAVLYPDGDVVVHGRGAPGLGLAVRSGLAAASKLVGRIVRRNARLESLRDFLDVE